MVRTALAELYRTAGVPVGGFFFVQFSTDDRSRTVVWELGAECTLFRKYVVWVCSPEKKLCAVALEEFWFMNFVNPKVVLNAFINL